jgi:hypothetical protein
MPQVPTSSDIGIFEVEYPIDTDQLDMRNAAQQPNSITQEDDDSPLASYTGQHCQGSITQDYMLHMMEQPGYKSPFMPCQASSRKYPLQFLCDLAYAILDDETGNLLKYHHLMNHPKHKDIWSKSLGAEIRRLVITTETIFFKCKDKIPAQIHDHQH